MKLNDRYLYDFSQERYRTIYGFGLKVRDELNVNIYNSAIILPARPDADSLFGRGG